MDIEKIKQVVNSVELTNNQKERIIISILSQDENVIPYILDMLSEERKRTKDCLLETNSELNRLFLAIENPKILKDLSKNDFIIKEVEKHYKKWEGMIGFTFKRVWKYFTNDN